MKIVDYVKETRNELRHVSWPTRKQAFVFTAIVIAISLAVAGFLGLFDFILSLVLSKFVI